MTIQEEAVLDASKDIELNISGQYRIIPLSTLNQSSLKIDHLSKLLSSE